MIRAGLPFKNEAFLFFLFREERPEVVVQWRLTLNRRRLAFNRWQFTTNAGWLMIDCSYMLAGDLRKSGRTGGRQFFLGRGGLRVSQILDGRAGTAA